MRPSKLEGERPLGDYWLGLAIVCLLLVETIAVAAPTTTPIIVATPQSGCPTGQTWLHFRSFCNISTDINAKPWPIREIKANGIPNHCVDVQYQNAIMPQDYDFKIPLNPWAAPNGATQTKVTVCKDPPQRFGVALNGVVFDPEDVAIWMQTGPTCGGPKKGDCIDNVPVSPTELKAGCPGVRWQVDPEEKVVALSSIMCCSQADLDMDDYVGHTQKLGQYHYHKLTPETAAAIGGVLVTDLNKRMTLVGWAFDGFPVYWKYGQLEPGGKMITMVSSWKIKKEWGSKKARDAGGPDVNKFPLGTFVNDYEYNKGTEEGALDECNGMKCYSPDLGQTTYCYFITDKFPYIPRCLSGNMAATVLNYGLPK